jgi:hypothetical protein
MSWKIGCLAKLALSLVLGATPFSDSYAATNLLGEKLENPSVLFSGSQSSNRIFIDQSTSTAAIGSIGVNQGTVLAPSPGATVIQNYYQNVPSSVTKQAFEALERRLSEATNSIELSRNELRLLAQALRDLDQRTADIEKLPDGRTKFGQLVTGMPRVVIQAYESGFQRLTNREFATALESFTNAISAIDESDKKATGVALFSGGSVPVEARAQIAIWAVQCAQELRLWDVAIIYSRKAVAAFNSGPAGEFLATSFANDGIQKLVEGDLHAAFDRFTNSISAYQSSTLAPGQHGAVLSTNQAARIFRQAGTVAQLLGWNAQADEFANKAVQSDESFENLALLFTTRWNIGHSAAAREAAQKAFIIDPAATDALLQRLGFLRSDSQKLPTESQ